MPRPEVVWGGGGVKGGCKTLVYRQWQLHHVPFVKCVNTTASIRTTYCCSFHKMQNVLSESVKFGGGDKRGHVLFF